MKWPQVMVGLVFVLTLGLVLSASADRSGCQRRHSCPSDADTYVCGDLGYWSQSPITA